jgi:hypothetical protein
MQEQICILFDMGIGGYDWNGEALGFASLCLQRNELKLVIHK